MSQKGDGADCIGFVAGVFDEVFGTKTVLPPYSTFDSLNRPAVMSETVRSLRRAWGGSVVVQSMEPGDILVMRIDQRVPRLGHIGIYDGAELWHSTGSVGVHSVTLDAVTVRRIYRLRSRPWF